MVGKLDDDEVRCEESAKMKKSKALITNKCIIPKGESFGDRRYRYKACATNVGVVPGVLAGKKG